MLRTTKLNGCEHNEVIKKYFVLIIHLIYKTLLDFNLSY